MNKKLIYQLAILETLKHQIIEEKTMTGKILKLEHF